MVSEMEKVDSGKHIKKRINPYSEKQDLLCQYCWGNLEEPKVIILGKNPSYSMEDEVDNHFFGNYLKLNCVLENRDVNVVNLLTNFEEMFYTSSTARWWRRAFTGWNYKTGPKTKDKKGAFENLEIEEKRLFMNNIAIFNLYGFYSEYLDKEQDNENYTIEASLLDKLKALMKKELPIYIMWYKSIDWWKNKGIDLDSYSGMVYVVNGSCSANKCLNNSITYQDFKSRKTH